MNDPTRQEYINKMTENLPVLRKKLKMSQKDLADIIGLSSYTILAIEKKQRSMTWNTFLSLLLVFMKKEETLILLCALNIYTDELTKFIEGNKQ